MIFISFLCYVLVSFHFIPRAQAEFNTSELAKVQTAAQLSADVVTSADLPGEKDKLKQQYELDFFEFHRDYTIASKVVNQRVVASKDGVCYLVFRGTDPSNTADVLQNGLVPSRTVEGTTCRVHSGFYGNLGNDGTPIKNIQGMINRCFNYTKRQTLVIAGHSQGGATAQIAQIIFRDLYPTLVTFGAARAVDGKCDLLNRHVGRSFRFVNTEIFQIDQTGNNVRYTDIVPEIKIPLNYRHYGQALLLSSKKDRLFYPDVIEVGVVSGDVGGVATIGKSPISVHNMDEYKKKLQDVTTYTRFRKLKNNLFCNADQHCASGRCEVRVDPDGTFRGEQTDEDALNGLFTFGEGTCRPTVSPGSRCNEDSDCNNGRSGYCKVIGLEGGFCTDYRGKLTNDTPCVNNNQCASGRCEGAFPSRCKPKLPNGQTCDENSDCLSGKCVKNCFICAQGKCKDR